MCGSMAGDGCFSRSFEVKVGQTFCCPNNSTAALDAQKCISAALDAQKCISKGRNLQHWRGI